MEKHAASDFPPREPAGTGGVYGLLRVLLRPVFCRLLEARLAVLVLVGDGVFDGIVTKPC